MPAHLKTIAYTCFALLAFAGNSILCRLALGNQTIDGSSFTIIRLASAAITLLIIIATLRPKKDSSTTKSLSQQWLPAINLFGYAICFSLAYYSLNTGTGALILFGVVQMVMMLANKIAGKKTHALQWLGIAIALIGLAYLVYPTLKTPSFFDFILMSAAGVGWAVYTLLGRHSTAAIYDTAINFNKTLPLLILLGIVSWQQAQLSLQGVLLASASGVIASGLGYAAWYAVLKHLTVSLAASLQLLVPILAAIGGILFVNESLTLRLIVASVLIIGGIAAVIFGEKLTSRQ